MSKKAMTKVAWSIEDARQVLSGGASKVDGMVLDHFSASALVQIFDALSPENQAKLEAMSLDRAMDIVWQLAAKHSGSVHTANFDLKCDDCDHVADNSYFGRPKTCPKCGSTNVSTRQDGWSPRPKGVGGTPLYGSVHTAYNDDGEPLGFDYPSEPGEDDSFDEDEFYDDFAHEAKIERHAIADEFDLRPLHTRVATAFLKKG